MCDFCESILEIQGILDSTSNSYLTNSTPRIFLRRDIFVQVISMQFPGLWNSATGFKVVIWTVLDDYENDVL